MPLPSKNDRPQQGLRAVMRVCFAAFLFLYFYLSQAASLSLAQHKLSQGQTSYHPLVGAIVLTALLWGLQRLVSRFVRFSPSLYTLTFFPSALVAVLLTAFTPKLHPASLVVSALLAVVWMVVVWRCATRSVDNTRNTQGGAATCIPHALLFFLLVFYMGLCGNSNDRTTYEVQVARALNKEDYAEALSIGRKSLATSHHLTALRAFAQSHTPEGLANGLFNWPLPPGGSEMLYLSPADSADLLFPPRDFYLYLGLLPPASHPERLSAKGYFEQAARRRPQTAARDYWLCALLLDKQLDRFAAELPHFYTVSDSVALPHYYAEALILYERICRHPVLHYADPNVVANYLDFKEKSDNIHHPVQRRNTLWREYGDTYWWYYYYHQ